MRTRALLFSAVVFIFLVALFGHDAVCVELCSHRGDGKFYARSSTETWSCVAASLDAPGFAKTPSSAGSQLTDL
jgi:hypothetical protein